MPSVLKRVGVTAAIILLAAACQHTSGQRPGGERPQHVVQHIVWIGGFENHEYSTVDGNPNAPTFNSLASQYTKLAANYAIRHPSQPNYMAQIGGSTFGCTTDSCPPVSGENLVDQLEAAGISWKGYMQSLPPGGSCTSPDRYPYASRHDPFAQFTDIRDDATRCGKVVNLAQLSADLANGLPRFAYISPDLEHDGHSNDICSSDPCELKQADGFLKQWAAMILPRLAGSDLLIISWDEGTTNAGCCGNAAGGHVFSIIAGPGAPKAKVITAANSTYSLLRLIEAKFGLSYLGATAPAIGI